MMHFKQQQGYSLVETLVAISILLLALVGPMTIVTSSLRSALYVTEQTTAVFLAQEGIEAVHAYRNSHVIAELESGNTSDTWDWTTDSVLNDCFVDDGQGGEAGCNIDLRNYQPFRSPSVVRNCAVAGQCALDESSSGRSVYVINGAGSSDSIYERVIELETISSEAVSVRVRVSWNAQLFAGQQREVVLETELYDIYGSP